MRLPYAPSEPSEASPKTAEIYSRIAARRAPRLLTPLDLTLLHSPPVAEGWNSFLGAIRTSTSVPSAAFEIAVCRIAALNGATYEWEHHAPLAEKAGVPFDAIKALQSSNEPVPALNEQLKAVVRYTDAMTRSIHVPDAVFEGLKEHFNETQVVELTAAIAAYNCVSRFLVALDVGEANARKIEA